MEEAWRDVGAALCLGALRSSFEWKCNRATRCGFTEVDIRQRIPYNSEESDPRIWCINCPVPDGLIEGIWSKTFRWAIGSWSILGGFEVRRRQRCSSDCCYGGQRWNWLGFKTNRGFWRRWENGSATQVQTVHALFNGAHPARKQRKAIPKNGHWKTAESSRWAVANRPQYFILARIFSF